MQILWPVAVVVAFVVGYRVALWLAGEPAAVRAVKAAFPGARVEEQTSLKVMHDVVYGRLGFRPRQLIAYDSLEIQDRHFRVETYLGPGGRAACLHFLIERRSVVVPVRLAEFLLQDGGGANLPDWSYLVGYLAYGQLPEWYEGAAIYVRNDGSASVMDEFSCGNMENLDRLSDSALLRAAYARWQDGQKRKASELAS